MRQFILIITFSITGITLYSQLINIYPVPKEWIYSRHNDAFTAQVRIPGREWQDLFEHKVQVESRNVQIASMVQFAFEGKVEMRVKANNVFLQDVQIRPLSRGVEYEVINGIIYLTLDKPQKLSLEVNGDKLHNLHIFADEPEKEIPNPEDSDVIYFGPGVHRPDDLPGNSFRIPSNTLVYLAPGAFVQGKFICNRVENIRFIGRGVILEPQRGFEITHSRNIEIDGITVINPQHYTVYGGESSGIRINNLKSFSARGWSDGIDLMSCSDIEISDVFLRNSDDCIAIYTHRWDYYGDARNYKITNSILWSDAAHPINIGLHGDVKNGGSIIDNLHFSNIDILRHNEKDRNYQGCMALSVSDENLVQNVTFENIRIDNIQEGQLLNLRVLFNEKYSYGPGKGIRNIIFKNIYYEGYGENRSVVEGFSDERNISNILFENIVINNKKINSFEEGNIRIGKHTNNILLK